MGGGGNSRSGRNRKNASNEAAVSIGGKGGGGKGGGNGGLDLVNMSRVNPGYKKGRIGSISGVISSFSRSLERLALADEWSLLEWWSLLFASREETEKMLGFLGRVLEAALTLEILVG